MKPIYIAAPFELKKEAIQLRQLFKVAGVDCNSHWLDLPPEEQESRTHAEQDLQEIEGARAFVLINPPAWARKGTGGRHFETAWAMWSHVPIVIIGIGTNIFHKLPGVEIVETPEQAIVLVTGGAGLPV